jgi:geranylgeranyl diphosphate synthase type I
MVMSKPALAESLDSPLLQLLQRELSDATLRHTLCEVAQRVPRRLWEQSLLAPLRSFLGQPGKEFRARLVAISYELAGGQGSVAADLPLLVEMLHAGSLIIDDIEDGSASRRGAPTLHASYGIPVALNCGNWLYFWPAALLERLSLRPAVELAMHRRISRALLACHYGQALDVSVAVDQLRRDEIAPVVEATTLLKTGSLMRLAAELGALAADAEQRVVDAVGGFGSKLGIGLQMLDDLGGIVSRRRRHKGYEDLRLARPTWAWAWVAARESDAGFSRLRSFQEQVRKQEAQPGELARMLSERVSTTGRKTVHQHLSSALDELAGNLGFSRSISTLRRELQNLQESYG